MGGAAMDNGRGAETEGMMPRDKKATPEEVEKIKAQEHNKKEIIKTLILYGLLHPALHIQE